MTPGGAGWCGHRMSLRKTSSLPPGLPAEAGILEEETRVTAGGGTVDQRHQRDRQVASTAFEVMGWGLGVQRRQPDRRSVPPSRNSEGVTPDRASNRSYGQPRCHTSWPRTKREKRERRAERSGREAERAEAGRRARLPGPHPAGPAERPGSRAHPSAAGSGRRPPACSSPATAPPPSATGPSAGKEQRPLDTGAGRGGSPQLLTHRGSPGDGTAPGQALQHPHQPPIPSSASDLAAASHPPPSGLDAGLP